VDEFLNPEKPAHRARNPSGAGIHPTPWRPSTAGQAKPGGQQIRRDLLREQGLRHVDHWLDTWRRGTGAKVDDVL